MTFNGNEDYCLTTLRETDRDRYLACLLMPEEQSRAISPLYAFNAEIARIRELVREPLPGEIRMQWWRDILNGEKTFEADAHPIAKALMKTIADHQLPAQVFQNMIDARVFDLYDDPMADVTSLEGYAGETASALIQLTSLVLDPVAAKTSAAAAGHAGIAQAVAGLLLLMPLHRHRGQVYVPQSLLSATGLDRDTFLAGEDKGRIDAAIEAFAGLGRDHLVKARGMSSEISKSNQVAFLPVSLAEPVLNRAVKLKSNMFETPLAISQWRRQWILWSARRASRF